MFQRSATSLGIAFALTLLAGMYAYFVNAQLGVAELLFVLLVSYAVVLGVRWLWGRLNWSRRDKS
jgi:hypothetical protein